MHFPQVLGTSKLAQAKAPRISAPCSRPVPVVQPAVLTAGL